jgi:hypothetical protein
MLTSGASSDRQTVEFEAFEPTELCFPCAGVVRTCKSLRYLKMWSIKFNVRQPVARACISIRGYALFVNKWAYSDSYLFCRC